MKTNEISTLPISLQSLLNAREALKQQLIAVDGAIDQVSDTLEVGDSIGLPDGRIIEKVDNFALTNTVFRPARVRRFELKEVKQTR